MVIICSYFSSIDRKEFLKIVVVICEISILFISLDTLKVEKDYLFSEIISDVKLENRIMKVVFIDDNKTAIPIDDKNSRFLTMQES